ncbi:HNH endonuclease [Priestia aryabhattai]|uniref:HNH endonuclease n=1 Tax=Priestia aryabhattai TaxID=412384 RepID=UPI003D2CB723
MTGRDMFGNKISEEQRKASLLQALGIAGAGALSTKVAGKMGKSLATKGTEKLNNMRNTLRTSAVANVTKQAYQSVKNAPASWTQSLHKTYNNILDSSMPRLVPDLVPAGPALAQQTVRETLQNVKQQTMQMVTKVKYDPVHNRYRGAGGRFMSKRDVEKLGDSVKVETVRRVDKPVKVESVSEREIHWDTNGKVNGTRLTLEDFNKEILETKPMNSPIPKKWYDKGGEIHIESDGTWTYTNNSGVSVRYPDGYPDFTPFMHPNVEPVKIEVHSPKNNPKDFENANIEAKLSKDTDPPIFDIRRPPIGYTWHHHQDGETMLLVVKDIHDEFKHIGGQSKINGKNSK